RALVEVARSPISNTTFPRIQMRYIADEDLLARVLVSNFGHPMQNIQRVEAVGRIKRPDVLLFLDKELVKKSSEFRGDSYGFALKLVRMKRKFTSEFGNRYSHVSMLIAVLAYCLERYGPSGLAESSNRPLSGWDGWAVAGIVVTFQVSDGVRVPFA